MVTNRVMLKAFVDLESSHHGHGFAYERGVTRKYPPSDVASDHDTLNVGHDIIGETPRHPGLSPNHASVAARNPLVDDMELDSRHWMSVVTSALV